jgi:perosamine synthetase
VSLTLLDWRRRVAALYGEALGGLEGLELPCPDQGGDRRSWFVYVVQLPAEVRRDEVVSALRERGVDSKSYLPSVHLFPHLRELGYREGQFPVAERAAARALGLPFFSSMREDEVERVCEALGAALAQSVARSSSTP